MHCYASEWAVCWNAHDAIATTMSWIVPRADKGEDNGPKIDHATKR